MKCFSAQYVFTNDGPPLKRAVVCTENDGTIINVEDTGGDLVERPGLEFHNGIIIPGLVNSHCHLELSYLRDEIPRGTGLSGFLKTVTSIRNTADKDREKAIISADNSMAEEGVVLCADICNTSLSFPYKKNSRIKYINLLEVFGIDPLKADQRIEEIVSLRAEAVSENLQSWIVPHAAYSVSLKLLAHLENVMHDNRVSSIHFMESEDEEFFLENQDGPLMEAYSRFLSPGSRAETVGSHVSAVLEKITHKGNLILVHNTYIGEKEVKAIKARGNTFYCLCPNSNLFIEKRLPPVNILVENGCEIVIGTDSLSSNTKLSLVEEMRVLQTGFPALSLESVIRWATINGAKALGQNEWAGTLSPGKKPGLVLLENLDLQGLKLLPETRSYRLI